MDVDLVTRSELMGVLVELQDGIADIAKGVAAMERKAHPDAARSTFHGAAMVRHRDVQRS